MTGRRIEGCLICGQPLRVARDSDGALHSDLLICGDCGIRYLVARNGDAEVRAMFDGMSDLGRVLIRRGIRAANANGDVPYLDPGTAEKMRRAGERLLE